MMELVRLPPELELPDPRVQSFPRRLLQEAQRRGWTEEQQRDLAERWYGAHLEDPTDLHTAEEEVLL